MPSILQKIYNHPVFPISLIFIFGLIAGVLTFQDFGMSWDEPLFYKYADAIPYAYSISERLSGSFDIFKAYGPSETDHMMYGPAYLLLARPIAVATMTLFSTTIATAWHLVNFIFFLTGCCFLYLLASRWMSRWAAFSATLLFLTQPLLWGHSFINPKDIPFTVFFIFAIYYGYLMVERTSLPDEIQSFSINQHPARWKFTQSLLWILSSICVLALLSTILFRSDLIAWFSYTIQYAIEHPESPAGTLFRLASNKSSAPIVAGYIAKGTALINRLPILLAAVTVILGSTAYIVTFQKNFLKDLVTKINIKNAWKFTVVAGVLVGFLSAIRILGPFAGLLVSLYFVFRFKFRAVLGLLAYAVTGFITMYMLWPFLWNSPVNGLLKVLKHMTNNPQNVPVLFNGEIIQSVSLPFTYFLTMLGLTLTEPVWFLFLGGLGLGAYWVISKQLDWKQVIPIGLWFFVPFLYVLIFTPPQYDGFRHFLFILPPVFIVCGFVFHKMFLMIHVKWLNPLIVILFLLPGIIGIIRLHPYQYIYYNTYIGGTNGASRIYETDYWLTCYKEVFDELIEKDDTHRTVFVHKNKYLATQYARDGFEIFQYEPDEDNVQTGDLLLMTSRSNYDQRYHAVDPSIIAIERDGALLCVVKRIQ